MKIKPTLPFYLVLYGCVIMLPHHSVTFFTYIIIPVKQAIVLFIPKFICCWWFTASLIYELSLLGFYINRMHHPVLSIQCFPVYKNKLASIFKKWWNIHFDWKWGQTVGGDNFVKTKHYNSRKEILGIISLAGCKSWGSHLNFRVLT